MKRPDRCLCGAESSLVLHNVMTTKDVLTEAITIREKWLCNTCQKMYTVRNTVSAMQIALMSDEQRCVMFGGTRKSL